MSIGTVEQDVRARIAQPAPNCGVIAVLLLAAFSIVVGLSYQSSSDAVVYVDGTAPLIAKINSP